MENNNYDDYIENDDSQIYLDNYISKIALWPPSINYKYENHIYVDLNLYRYINCPFFDIKQHKQQILDHFDGDGYNGTIYCLRQIKNIFNDYKIKLLQKNKKLYITNSQNEIHELRQFVIDKIYNKSFDDLTNMFVNKIDHKSSDDNLDTLYLSFIGSTSVGILLINKLILYNKHIDKTINFIFILKKSIGSFNIIYLIKEHFTNYEIYSTNEFGNDIIPTMLVYNLVKNNHNYDNIIKLQTKQTNDRLFDDIVDYLLSNDINRLKFLCGLDKTSNCVCEPTYKNIVSREKLNLDLIQNFKHITDSKTHFCVGTMFYTKPIVMDKILEHIKEPNNYRMYLYNNTYDNNTFFYSKSPIHFLERLFGNIKID